MKRRPTNLADYKQPLPHAIVDCLKDRPHPREGDNLGLWLDKYLPLAPDSFELKAEARTDILSRFFCARKLGRPIAWRSRSASEVVARQAQSCEAMFGKEGTYYLRLPMRVEGRLLIDYARLSTIESSLSFHATLGVPRIPGSALKGLLRATMRSEGDPELDELLGSPDLERDNDKTHKRGRLVLFDAFPDGSFELDLDVLTPHFGDYYGDTTGKTPPAESPETGGNDTLRRPARGRNQQASTESPETGGNDAAKAKSIRQRVGSFNGVPRNRGK